MNDATQSGGGPLHLAIPPALIDHGLLTSVIGKGHVPHPKRNVTFNQRRTNTAIDLPPTLSDQTRHPAGNPRYDQ